jgi:ElaA protein
MTNWICKAFDELTAAELYAILRLRSEVFVVEQNCVFLDMDDKDQYCHHLIGRRGEILAGYCRIVPAGISYEESSIGRIVTSPVLRGHGIGRELILQSVHSLYMLYGKQPIRIGAQYYLLKFYESFGFVQKGEIYLEDGIEHVQMLMTNVL